MAGGIFVSYRRDDTRQAAGRLADDLAERFGSANIFRDIEGIELGVDFAQALNQALGACVVMLVLIGTRWLDITDARGRRRLDDPRDWIRQEIATALTRGIRVVPVLIDGTALPDEASLSEDLQPLVRRQALEISDMRWRGDLQRLVDTLARVPGLALQGPPSVSVSPSVGALSAPHPPGKKQLWIGIAIGVFGLLGVGAYVAEQDKGNAAPVEPMVALPPASPVPVLATPAPAPAAPAATVPNLAGLWRTLGGETYQFVQQGQQLRFTAQAGGQPVGGGEGQIDGALLRLSMSLVINGVPLGAANCNLQGSPDFSRFAGVCQTQNGPFQAQMFR